MKYNYGDALGLSILFYDAQRSGRLWGNNSIPWRGDSAVNDNDGGHDLSGGWYDGMYRVKSGIFGQTAKFGQWPCLFHVSNIGIKHEFTKQTVKILMRRLIRSRLIWIYTVCKCVSEFT